MTNYEEYFAEGVSTLHIQSSTNERGWVEHMLRCESINLACYSNDSPLLQVQSYFDANQADSGVLHKIILFSLTISKSIDQIYIQIEETSQQATVPMFTLNPLIMKPGAPTSLQQLKEVDPNLHSFLGRLLNANKALHFSFSGIIGDM